jgi:hypothetical protein
MANFFACLEEAAEGNDWDLVAAIQTHPGGNGYVPHGIAMVRRRVAPLENREYAVVDWSHHTSPAEHCRMGRGEYDLTEKEALARFAIRADLGDPTA